MHTVLDSLSNSMLNMHITCVVNMHTSRTVRIPTLYTVVVTSMHTRGCILLASRVLLLFSISTCTYASYVEIILK